MQFPTQVAGILGTFLFTTQIGNRCVSCRRFYAHTHVFAPLKPYSRPHTPYSALSLCTPVNMEAHAGGRMFGSDRKFGGGRMFTPDHKFQPDDAHTMIAPFRRWIHGQRGPAALIYY